MKAASARETVHSHRYGSPGRIEILILTVLAIGALLRVGQWLSRRSYYIDEAALLVSVFRKPVHALIGEPLLYDQSAPLGFLALERAAFVLLGPGELAMRLLPLLAGLASLPLFALLCWRLLPPVESLVLSSFFAFSSVHIYFSADAKPYSTDLLFSLLLLLTTERILRQGLSAGRLVGGVVTAAIAVLFSQPSILLIGCCGGIIAATSNWRDSPSSRARTAVLLAAWGIIAFLALAAARTRMTDTGLEYMQAFWESGFWPMPPRSTGELAWLPTALARFSVDPLGSAVPGLLMIPVIFGISWLARTDRRTLALGLVPVAVALFASALHQYPFGANGLSLSGKNGRILLYLVPSALLLIGGGLTWLRLGLLGTLPRVHAFVVALLFASILIRPAIAFPERRQEIRPVLEYVARKRDPDDRHYVYYGAQHAFEVYAPDLRLPLASTYFGRCSRPDPAGYLLDLEELTASGRVWLIIAHPFGMEGPLLIDRFNSMGERIDEIVTVGASAFLYDFSHSKRTVTNTKDDLLALPPTQWQRIGCGGPFTGLRVGWGNS